MSKRDLTEADMCAKWITPALLGAGWDEHTQLRREVHFTKGQACVDKHRRETPTAAHPFL